MSAASFGAKTPGRSVTSFTCCFNLPNGGYIYRDLESLKEIIQDAIDGEDWDQRDHEALTLLTTALNSIDPDDNDLFVSVDY